MLNRMYKWIVLACCTALLLLFVGCGAPVQDTLEIHMIDVGNADCFLIKQGSAAMLIDGGNPDNADHIVSYLHTHGVERLDAVLLTHPHTDHIGSLTRVVQAYATTVVYHAVLPTALQETSLLHTRFYEAVEQTGTVLVDAASGVNFSLGKAMVRIYPLIVQSDDANDYSLAARVSFGAEHALFVGDATENAQRALMESGEDITASVLKISHHGGRVDTTRAFLRAVGPQLALISCGAENSYGHPHTQTISALKEQQIIYYRTDVHGNTVLTIDSNGDRFITTAR